MGAQGFYKEAEAPQYPYTQNCSPPLRLELEIAFAALS